MKKLFKMFVLILAVMFVSNIKVSAATIDNWADLKACLTDPSTTSCETSTAIPAADEKISAVGNKTLILGDTLTLKQRIKVENGAKLVVKGDITVDGLYIFIANTGATLELEEGTFKALSRNASSALAVSINGGATVDAAKTNVKIGANAKIVDAGVAIFDTSAAAYGVTVDVYGDISMTKSAVASYHSFTTNGNIKPTTGENLPTINFYSGSSITNEGAPAIYAAGYAIWNIEEGTSFTGSEALSIKSGKFNINGGTFVGNGAYVSPDQVQAYNNGSEDTGAAISITGNDGYAAGVELNIKNADVNSVNGYAIFEGITSGTNPAVKSMSIEDGTFAGKVGATYAENAKGFIKGGEYSSEIEDEYVAADLEKEEINGNWYVGSKFAVNVSKAENGTISADLTSSFAGQTVTITTKANDKYALSKLVVTDKNGNEIEVKDGKFVMPESDVTITATFKENVEVPKTIDNVSLYLSLALISAAFSIIAFRKIKQRI